MLTLQDVKSPASLRLEYSWPRTRFPISAFSKKQTCVSHSTPEAEIVAGAYALRHEGLPGQVYFDALCECYESAKALSMRKGGGTSSATARKKRLVFHGDNAAMIQVCKSGRNPTMRHLGRTHGISITWLHDETMKDSCELRYIETSKMAADIFTKFFPHRKRETWDKVRRLINVLSPEEIQLFAGAPGEGWYDMNPSDEGESSKSTTGG